ncbi:MAG: ABC transporter transmembrane domain-containing protein [Gammaproteobacteria bacterium]|nr:ABC transporter transmembrane domain-containing protein [Gammaproteobacteria bacterium]
MSRQASPGGAAERSDAGTVGGAWSRSRSPPPRADTTIPGGADGAQAPPRRRRRDWGLGALWDLRRFLRPYRAQVALAVFFLFAASAATLAMPVTIRLVIDAGILAEQTAAVHSYFLLLFLLAALLALSSAMRYYLVTTLGERVVADLRREAYAHVIRLGPPFFESVSCGEVLSRLNTDTTLIQTVVGSNLSVALRSLIVLVGALALMFATSPWLGGAILLLVPPVVFPLVYFGRRVRRLSRIGQDRVADASGLAVETLNAATTIQAFNLEQRASDRFSHLIRRSFIAARQRIHTRAVLTALVILLVFGSVVLVLWLGAQDVISGRMSSGTLGQFLLYAILVAGSTAGLSDIWGELQRAAGATERLLQLIAIVPETRARAPQRLMELTGSGGGGGKISFQNISFRYPARPGVAALQDFSLEIAAGETVALVGPSGAGKTTLFRLLLRFYSPDSGIVLLDDVDASLLAPSEVRARIGLVPQEIALFTGSVLDNIRYGRPDADEGEVLAAARAAYVHEFVEQQPDGYDTFLGERGLQLSMGQRQRIAIARAILKDSPILLLDEATSALDAASEYMVQQALRRIMAGRTTLMIAHRLSMAKHADRIVVLDEGQVVAMGRHEELTRRQGLYSRLVSLQVV